MLVTKLYRILILFSLSLFAITLFDCRIFKEIFFKKVVSFFKRVKDRVFLISSQDLKVEKSMFAFSLFL